MSTHNEQVGFLTAIELGDAFLVGAQLFSIERGQHLLDAQQSRHLRVPVDGAGMIESVAAVQDPTVPGVDRYRGVAAGMARHGDQDNAGADGVKGLGGVVFDEVGPVRPLLAAIADLFLSGGGVHRAERFGRGDVDLGVREVGQTADVVEVEVGDDNVTDIVAVEPEPFDLVRGRLAGQQLGPADVPERADPAGVFTILESKAGIDQHQATMRMVGFNEQHMANDLAPGTFMVPQLRW